jgi:hypothetical protein
MSRGRQRQHRSWRRSPSAGQALHRRGLARRSGKEASSWCFWRADLCWHSLSSANECDPRAGLRLAAPSCGAPATTTSPADRAPGAR